MNYYYITGHGIGPGSLPSGLENFNFIEEQGFKSIFNCSTDISKDDLDKYEIYRWCPSCKKRFTSYPAISRKDNETAVCADCGISEALNQFRDYTAIDVMKYGNREREIEIDDVTHQYEYSYNKSMYLVTMHRGEIISFYKIA